MREVQNLNFEEEAYVESKVQRFGASSTPSYLLWFFFGGLGIHRFYLGAIKSGITMLALNICGMIVILIATFNIVFSAMSTTNFVNYVDCAERNPRTYEQTCDMTFDKMDQNWDESPPVAAIVLYTLGFALLTVVAIWWIVDAFLIPGMMRRKNQIIRMQYIQDVLKRRRRESERDNELSREYDAPTPPQ